MGKKSAGSKAKIEWKRTDWQCVCEDLFGKSKQTVERKRAIVRGTEVLTKEKRRRRRDSVLVGQCLHSRPGKEEEILTTMRKNKKKKSKRSRTSKTRGGTRRKYGSGSGKTGEEKKNTKGKRRRQSWR